VKWFSATDVSEPEFGLVCSRVLNPPPGDTWRGWAGWRKIAQLIDDWPW
jgi:hypothetical protein